MTQSSYPKMINDLKWLAEWEAPNGVLYSDHIGRDEIAVIARALLHIIENQSSPTTAKQENE